MIASATLPSLLRAALNGLEGAYIGEGAGAGQMPSLEMWANLLRAIDSRGIDVRQLPAILRLSRRAVRSKVSWAARNGWVEQLKGDRGGTRVRLTLLGSDAAVRWPSVEGSAERRWQAEIGADRAGKLRSALEEIVAKLPLEHPHYPASYGAADASITGGNGQDWKPVPRAGGDTVRHLPVSALISQALVAFAMQYEEKSPVALSLSTSVITGIPAERLCLQRLASPVGVAALHRHGFVRVSGHRGSEVVYLTPKGLAVRGAYDERIRAVETEWREAFGDQAVAALRQASAALQRGT